MKSPESEWRENAKPEDNYLRFYLELSAVHIWYAKVEVKSRLRRKAALAISGILKKKSLFICYPFSSALSSCLLKRSLNALNDRCF